MGTQHGPVELVVAAWPDPEAAVVGGVLGGGLGLMSGASAGCSSEVARSVPSP